MRSLPTFCALVLLCAPAALAATLRVAVPATVPTFGAPFTRPGPAEIRFAVYDTLTREDSTGRLGPALALSWRMKDPTTWEFDLRPGVRFSNGVPFTARTVGDTIAILQADAAKVFDLAGEVAGIVAVVAEGDGRVRIRTRTPDLLLPRRLQLIRMVEPEAWKRLGAEAYSKAPIGTGPYRVADWGGTTGETILEAVPGSWREPAEMTRVKIRYAPDETARVQALLSGKVDLAFALSPDDIGTLESAGMTPLVFPAPMVMALTLRNRPDASPALSDRRVRQALNLAINRPALAHSIMADTMPPARTGFTRGTTGGDADLTPYGYDPDRARELLKEAGYATGLKLVAGVTIGQVANDTLIFQAVAADLRNVGVDLELRTLTFPDFIDRLTAAKWQGIDAFSMLWGAASYADAYRFLERHSCANPAAYFCEPAAMPRLAAVRAATDPSSRERALKDAVAAYHELAPAIWLLEYANILGAAGRLKNVTLAFEGIHFERMTFAP